MLKLIYSYFIYFIHLNNKAKKVYRKGIKSNFLIPGHYTNSMITSSAPSPLRGPILMILV